MIILIRGGSQGGSQGSQCHVWHCVIAMCVRLLFGKPWDISGLHAHSIICPIETSLSDRLEYNLGWAPTERDFNRLPNSNFPVTLEKRSETQHMGIHLIARRNSKLH